MKLLAVEIAYKDAEGQHRTANVLVNLGDPKQPLYLERLVEDAFEWARSADIPQWWVDVNKPDPAPVRNPAWPSFEIEIYGFGPPTWIGHQGQLGDERIKVRLDREALGIGA
jgi:hypothetical protein